MKSPVRTISVLVVLFLVTGSFILAEDTPQKPDEEKIQKILEDMNRRAKEDPLYRESLKRLQELQRARQKELEASLAVQEEHLIAVQERLKEQDERFQVERIQKLVLGGPSQYGAGRVLVIPTEQMNPKQLLMITEDLNIMSRILDRKLDDADLGRDYDWFYGENFLEWNIPVTKCIYLQEHGVLFLKKVDFPLSPPVEPNAIEKIKQDYDPVWEQTRRQMYFRRNLFEQRHRKGKSREQYDARKVETLKRTLIEALRHAANIRNLEDDDFDWVIITVVGESSDSGESADDDRRTQVQFRREIRLRGESGDKVEFQTTLEPSTKPAYLMGHTSATVMTMRVNKGDIDEFYEGEINFDEFRQKVEVFIY